MATEPREETLDERLRAVERALTDDETPVPDLADAAAVEGRLDGAENRLDDAEDRLDELAASVQAVRGYVGEVRERRTATVEETRRQDDSPHDHRDDSPHDHRDDSHRRHRPVSGRVDASGDAHPLPEQQRPDAARRPPGAGEHPRPRRSTPCPRCGATGETARRGREAETSDPGRDHPLPDFETTDEERSLLDRLLDR